MTNYLEQDSTSKMYWNLFIVLMLVATLFLFPEFAFADFNQDSANSFYEDSLVPMLLGSAVLAFVGVVGFLIAGKPEGAGWAVKIGMALVLAGNSKTLVMSVWEAFKS